MVKNTHGGSGHKSQARKNQADNSKYSSSKLRLRNPDDDEVYAQVLGILGGGVCSVLCHDNVDRLCMIRGKFRGRGKRDNTLYRGSWILVALRTWSGTSKAGKEHCDLLEIYSDADKKRLPSFEPTINWTIFANSLEGATKNHSNEDAGFEFSDEKTDEYMELIQSSKGKNITLESTTQEAQIQVQAQAYEEEINVDDI